MASPYDKVGKRTLPYSIPGDTAFGVGEKGAAGARIESHPFYRHRLNKRYMKRSRDPLRGRRRVYSKPDYDPDSGLPPEQWDSITKGSGVRGMEDTGQSPELGLAGVVGGKWYSQSQFGEGGQLKEGAQGFGGDSVYGTLAQSDNWQGIYEGGGMGLPSWAEGWYEPARYVGVEQQLETMQEVGSDSEFFRRASNIGLPTEGAYGIETEGLDMDAPIGKGTSGQFGEISGTVAGAEESLREELASVYGQGDIEGSLAQLDRERAMASEELKGERLGITAQRAPRMERAQAQRAATGLAYSGPTERAIKFGQQEELASLGDVVRKERDLEQTYKTGYQKEVERAQQAQRGFSGAGGQVQTYWENLKGIFEGAQTEAQNVAIAGEDLLNAWSDFGESRGLADTTLSGMGVSGYGAFRETPGEYQPYAQFQGTQGTPQRAERFAQDLIDQANTRITGLVENPDVDLSLIGQ